MRKSLRMNYLMMAFSILMIAIMQLPTRKSHQIFILIFGYLLFILLSYIINTSIKVSYTENTVIHSSSFQGLDLFLWNFASLFFGRSNSSFFRNGYRCGAKTLSSLAGVEFDEILKERVSRSNSGLL